MRLDQIAALLKAPVENSGASTAEVPEITGLVYDSRDVVPGAVFFCRKGREHDGHEFAAEAVSRGASALVSERLLDLPVAQIVVADAQVALNHVASPYYGEPSSQLRITGITGTNGKTTTAHMLHSIFRAHGDPAGLIGTVESRIGERRIEGVRTTPESIDLQRLFREMADAGVVLCAMEVTSHAIDQQRIAGTLFEVAVFTNLSQDHLDYHGSIDEYFAAKRALFDSELVNMALINVDDPWGSRIAESARAPVKTFGVVEEADFRALRVELGPAGSRFDAFGHGMNLAISVNMPADFNVSNALAAASAAYLQGIPDEAIAEGIEALKAVPGRFEPIDRGQDFAVIVDYAHTPAGLAGVLQAAGALGPGRVIVVFGCGGDRDRSKRPLMGEVAAKHADVVYITSDNPRSEDPESIIKQIEQGLTRAPTRPAYVTEPDRASAIESALHEASLGDVVVIAGKGHESYQEFSDRTIPFDDRVVAAEALERLS